MCLLHALERLNPKSTAKLLQTQRVKPEHKSKKLVAQTKIFDLE
jgi:hypothetical protein